MIRPGAIALFVLGLAALMLLGDFVLFGIFIGAGIGSYFIPGILKLVIGIPLAGVLVLNVAGFFLGFMIPIPYVNFFQQIALGIGGVVIAYYGYQEAAGQS